MLSFGTFQISKLHGQMYVNLKSSLNSMTTFPRRALPSHVFRPSVSTSLYFVARDAASVAALYAAVVAAEANSPEVVPEAALKYLIYPIYWFLQVRK